MAAGNGKLAQKCAGELREKKGWAPLGAAETLTKQVRKWATLMNMPREAAWRCTCRECVD